MMPRAHVKMPGALFPLAESRRKARRRRPAPPERPALPRDRWHPGPILALDPSSVALGWALLYKGEVCRAGVRRVPRGWDLSRRVDALAAHAMDLIDRGPHDQKVVMEYASGMHRRSTPVEMAALAHAQGAIRMALRMRRWQVEMVAEVEWTRGQGAKRHRVKMHRLSSILLREIHTRGEDDGGDAADAAGVGLWWAQRNEV